MSQSSLDLILEQYGNRKPWGPIPSADDWDELESRIGRYIPHDYRMIVDRTGGCPMGSCYLWNPAERDNIYISFSEGAMSLRHSQIARIAEAEFGISIYPEDSRCIPCGTVDSTYFCYASESDAITILDLFGDGVCDTGLGIADLLWGIFVNRDWFEDLGHSIWTDKDSFFWPK
jgi:hypothetical protein